MWQKLPKHYKQIIKILALVILLFSVILLYKPVKMWYSFHTAKMTSYDSKDIDIIKNNCSAKSEEVVIDGMFPNEGNARSLIPSCKLNFDQIEKKIGYTWMEF